MTIREFGLVMGMVLASAFATGCGADCESLCEDGKECSGADKNADCAKLCSDAEANAEKAGCTDQYDDLLSCADGEDACATNVCKSEGDAFGKCVVAFCTKNPEDAACASGG